MHWPFAAELLKIGLTLLARRGNLPFEARQFLVSLVRQQALGPVQLAYDLLGWLWWRWLHVNSGVSSVAGVPDPEARPGAVGGRNGVRIIRQVDFPSIVRPAIDLSQGRGYAYPDEPYECYP